MPLCAHHFHRPWPVVGEEAVDALNPVVVGAAVLWGSRQLLVTRRKLRTAQVIIPPLFAATLVFLLSILVGVAIGASPLPLLWLFPLSFGLGLGVVLFPLGVEVTLACLALLAGPPSLAEPQPITRRIRAPITSRHRRPRRR